MSLLVSFCIPTYNGLTYLPELVASLLPQIDSSAEIIFCDDGSNDGTWQYLENLAVTSTQIKVFRNPQNLGMDRNFHQAVKHAQGQYIWLSGQDDVFGSKAFQTFLDAIQKHPSIDFVYFNYRQLFTEPEPHYGETYLDIQKDSFTQSSEEYFTVTNRAPSFLPAIVMRKKVWDTTKLSDYYGTLYVQVGCWLENCENAHVYIVADPTHVDCRCPNDSWKFTDGNMWYSTKVGTLAAYHIARQKNPLAYPASVYENILNSFLKELPFDCVFFKAKGMRLNNSQRKMTYLVFGRRPMLYWCYIIPCIYLPVNLAKVIASFYKQPFLRTCFRRIRKFLPYA